MDVVLNMIDFSNDPTQPPATPSAASFRHRRKSVAKPKGPQDKTDLLLLHLQTQHEKIFQYTQDLKWQIMMFEEDRLLYTPSQAVSRPDPPHTEYDSDQSSLDTASTTTTPSAAVTTAALNSQKPEVSRLSDLSFDDEMIIKMLESKLTHETQKLHFLQNKIEILQRKIRIRQKQALALAMAEAEAKNNASQDIPPPVPDKDVIEVAIKEKELPPVEIQELNQSNDGSDDINSGSDELNQAST